MSKSVIVVGAGIVGISTVIWLQRFGCKVTLIDKQISREATSFGNAGILAACAIVPLTTPGLIYKAPKMLFSAKQPLFMRWGYLPKLLPWLGKYLSHCKQIEVERIAQALTPIIGNSLKDHQLLSDGTVAAQFVHPDDYLYLYDDHARFEADAMDWEIRRKNGFSWEVLKSEQIQEFDPSLPATGGVLVKLANHGRISNPGNYIKALTAHAVSQGAELITGEVADFLQDSGQITGVKTVAGQVLKADAVAVTTGVWSVGLSKKLGIHVPMETERGYHVELVEPSISPRSPVMVARGKFVMTPMENRLRLAGIVEFGGLKAEASSTPIELLLRNVRQLLPGITWKDQSEWLGHRPAPVDSIPLIGKLGHIPGLYTGCGHHHVGLTGGPRTGQLLAQLISGQQPDIDLSAYRPNRFSV